jgi:CBS domain-containing protein
MKARDVMSTELDVVTRYEPLSHVAEIMRDAGVGMVPVVRDRDGMQLAGVITDRDIVVRHVAEGHQSDPAVADHMTSGELQTVGPDAELREVADLMKATRVRRVLVTAEDGRVVGVVSETDIARVLGLQESAGPGPSAAHAPRVRGAR